MNYLASGVVKLVIFDNEPKGAILISVPIARQLNGNVFAIVICTAVVLIALAHGLPFGTSSPLLIDLRNSLHAPAFMVFAMLLFLLLVQKVSQRAAITLTAITALAAGILGELSQFLSSGQTSLSDLLSDSLGILFGICIGLLLITRRKNRSNRRHTTLLVMFSAIIALIVVYPVAHAVHNLVSQNRAMPTIMDFEENWQTRALFPMHGASTALRPAPDSWGNENGQAVYVELSPMPFSGAKIYPVSNWSEYTFLTFTAASGNSGNFEIVLRINDDAHNGNFSDRFGRRFELSSKKRVYRIPISEIRSAPADREMDITHIHAIFFFMRHPTGEETLILDDVRLER